jgi:hypothetical protein
VGIPFRARRCTEEDFIDKMVRTHSIMNAAPADSSNFDGESRGCGSGSEERVMEHVQESGTRCCYPYISILPSQDTVAPRLTVLYS